MNFGDCSVRFSGHLEAGFIGFKQEQNLIHDNCITKGAGNFNHFCILDLTKVRNFNFKFLHRLSGLICVFLACI